MNSIWNWTRQTLLPGLHPEPLYDSLQIEPYMADRMSLRLGTVRLRQVRVQKGIVKCWRTYIYMYHFSLLITPFKYSNALTSIDFLQVPVKLTRGLKTFFMNATDSTR